jgi:ubiquinone/menaquinone biosynthesis C-methylase UbiE
MGGDFMDHLSRLTPEEKAQRERLGERYRWAIAPVMLEIERRVCGCDYGGSSWTTQEEADFIAGRLALKDGDHLLDLGAGSGWPGLYFSQATGCSVTLVDLPIEGLKLAKDRAKTDGLSNHVSAAVADASHLPFMDHSFDAISHSDLLCCLIQKHSVLSECRRVLSRTGRMAFTVISVPQDLAPDLYREGIESGPEFVETDQDYPSLLADTKWAVSERHDITPAYSVSCNRQLEADIEYSFELTTLLGEDIFEERIESWRIKLSALARGLLRRELFLVAPI